MITKEDLSLWKRKEYKKESLNEGRNSKCTIAKKKKKIVTAAVPHLPLNPTSSNTIIFFQNIFSSNVFLYKIKLIVLIFLFFFFSYLLLYCHMGVLRHAYIRASSTGKNAPSHFATVIRDVLCHCWSRIHGIRERKGSPSTQGCLKWGINQFFYFF